MLRDDRVLRVRREIALVAPVDDDDAGGATRRGAMAATIRRMEEQHADESAQRRELRDHVDGRFAYHDALAHQRILEMCAGRHDLDDEVQALQSHIATAEHCNIQALDMTDNQG